ncbi:MAG: hypothetical protein EOO11_16880 [Chitinophagaceae bacterium]|nr:MAG: hypothetical protein EOO11_16880 [Chitinophagaceae bacterium]
MRQLLFLIFLATAQAAGAQAPYRLFYSDSGSTEAVLPAQLRIYNETNAPLLFLAYTCSDAANLLFDSSHLRDGQLLQCRTNMPMLVSVAPHTYCQWTARFERTEEGRKAFRYLQEERFGFRLCRPKGSAVAGIITGPMPPMDTLLLSGVQRLERHDPYPEVDAARPKLFELVFRNQRLPEGLIIDSFAVVGGDTIHLRSGLIALSNVEGARKARPLPLRLPKGRFPVEWAMGYDAASGSAPGAYAAYARIRFSNAPVARWALATDTAAPLWNDGLPPRVALPEESAYELLLFGDVNDVRALGAKVLSVAPLQGAGAPPGYHQFYGKGRRGVFVSSGMYSARSAYAGFDASGTLCTLLIDTGLYQIAPSSF